MTLVVADTNTPTISAGELLHSGRPWIVGKMADGSYNVLAVWRWDVSQLVFGLSFG